MGINYLEKLNETFFELLEDLIRVFPSDGDFRIYSMAVETALTLDDAFLFNIIQKKIIVYEPQILARDEEFMVNFDVASNLDSSPDKVKQTVVHVIQKLRSLWHVISESDKDVVWKYLRTIVLLYQKCKTTLVIGAEQPNVTI